MARQRTVCVVEDDPGIRRGLVDSLEFAGFRVHACADGPSARRTLALTELDLVLLDVVLPGLDGIDFLPELRAARPVLPVILVTARGAEEDRVRGLRNGADDYVVKPFSSSELLARHLSRAVEREELLRSVWGLDPRGLDTRTVDMAVVRLREKLGPSGADIVRTVRGKGYVLGDGARVER